MNNSAESVVDILSACESNPGFEYIVKPETYEIRKTPWFTPSAPRQTEPVPYDAGDNDVFIVSDLHIGSGRTRTGLYPGTENFFADESFERFLSYADRIKKTENAVLVMNGDTFDFVRIIEYPGIRRTLRAGRKVRYMLQGNRTRSPHKPSTDSIRREYQEWCAELRKLGIQRECEDLAQSIDAEKEFGLGTEDFKAIYKLMKTRQGHPRFFAALAAWLNNGNKLVLIKGNHDLELCRRNVRNYIRLVLAEEIAAGRGEAETIRVLRDIVLRRVKFIDDAVAIDGDVCVEHGHRYDKFTMVLENPTAEDESAPIALPFGSLFNRYVINRVELFFPFLDNVRPPGDVLAMMIRMNFPLAVRIFFQHIPAVFHVVLKKWKYAWYMIQRPLLLALAALVPIAVAVLTNLQYFKATISHIRTPSGVADLLLEQAKNIGLLIFSYLLSRLVAWMQLTEPSSLETYARERFDATGCRIVAMGHTHNPGQYIHDGSRGFYDTGTWIPVIETSTAEVRQDRTYTFLHLVRDEDQKLLPANDGVLQRWNDDAGRAEPYAQIERR